MLVLHNAQDRIDVLQVLLEGLGVHEDVIQIGQSASAFPGPGRLVPLARVAQVTGYLWQVCSPHDGPQDVVHEHLEAGW
eukprot:8128000-Prorocentrum_lima.AAC.1